RTAAGLVGTVGIRVAQKIQRRHAVQAAHQGRGGRKTAGPEAGGSRPNPRDWRIEKPAAPAQRRLIRKPVSEAHARRHVASIWIRLVPGNVVHTHEGERSVEVQTRNLDAWRRVVVEVGELVEPVRTRRLVVVS